MSTPTTSTNLLDLLISGSIRSLTKLQDSLQLTIDQITTWIGRYETRAQLDKLQLLFNSQAQLMICQHRLFAVAKLAEVIATASAPETIRRACVDVLKINLTDFSASTPGKSGGGDSGGGGNPMQPTEGLVSEMINHHFNRMSEKDLESYEESGKPSPNSEAPRSDDSDATQSEPTTQFARAHYTSGGENPDSDVMRNDSREARAHSRTPLGARTDQPLSIHTSPHDGESTEPDSSHVERMGFD